MGATDRADPANIVEFILIKASIRCTVMPLYYGSALSSSLTTIERITTLFSCLREVEYILGDSLTSSFLKNLTAELASLIPFLSDSLRRLRALL